MNIKLIVAVTLFTLATMPIKSDVPQGPIKFGSAKPSASVATQQPAMNEQTPKQPTTVTATISFTVHQPSGPEGATPTPSRHAAAF